MQYHWHLGVGHLHAHRLTSTSSWIPDQSRNTDSDASNNSSTNHEDLTGDLEPHVTDFDSNACYKSVNPEMTLDELDLEGWEDVESDTLEVGCGKGNDNSGDDFTEMFK
jgi:hypothetical protein